MEAPLSLLPLPPTIRQNSPYFGSEGRCTNRFLLSPYTDQRKLMKILFLFFALVSFALGENKIQG